MFVIVLGKKSKFDRIRARNELSFRSFTTEVNIQGGKVVLKERERERVF